MIAGTNLPVVGNQALLRIISDVSVVGWIARVRIEGPTVTEVRDDIQVVGPDQLAMVKTGPSLIGRPYELHIIDPDRRAHLLATGVLTLGVLAIPTDFTYSSLDPESIPGGGTGGGGGGPSNLYIQEASPEPVPVNSLWVELNPDDSPKTVWVAYP